MSDEQLLKRFGEMIVANNKTLIATITRQINESIQSSEARTAAAIKVSQKDTIDVLTAVMNEGYELHDVPPLKRS